VHFKYLPLPFTKALYGTTGGAYSARVFRHGFFLNYLCVSFFLYFKLFCIVLISPFHLIKRGGEIIGEA